MAWTAGGQRHTPTRGRRTSYDAEAYLVDSTLSELALSSHQAATSTPWAWFTSPGLADDVAVPPPLPEGTIPTIKMEDFKRYLASVATNLEEFERKSEEERILSPRHGGRVTPVTSPHRRPSTPTQSTPTGIDQAVVDIPLQYFREDFFLDWDLLGPIDTPEQQQVVVDELSSQLDRIETHLTSEIAAKYSSFFEASIYIQELRNDVERLVDEVRSKRAVMGGLGEDTRQGSQTNEVLRNRKENLLHTLELVTTLQQILHAKSAMQSSLDTVTSSGFDYIGALEVLEALREGWNGAVRGVWAVGGVPDYIERVESAMKDSMVEDLVERTTMDVATCLVAVFSSQQTENGKGGDEEEEGEEDQNLVPLVMSLCRIKGLKDASEAIQKHLYRGMAHVLARVVREYLVEECKIDADDISDDLDPGILAVALSKASSDQYLRLLQLAQGAVHQGLAHAEKVTTRLLKALSLSSSSLSLSPKDMAMTRQRIKEISHEAAQLSLTFWGTLLTSWTSIATADELGLGQLTEILSTTDAFASLAEGHVGKTVAVLQAPIQQSCKTALDLMHAANIARLSQVLEGEKWTYAPISESTASGLSLFLSDSHPSPSSPLSSPSSSPTAIAVAGKSFQLVRTAQALVDILKRNLEFAETVPAFVTDIGQRVVEILRSFNSRTCQLILGAGAMQVSGLKSITVKHLTVACHTVRFILALFPHLVHKFVTPLPPPRQALLSKEFDRTKQDMDTHCVEINNKIIFIMCERLVPSHDYVRLLTTSLGGGEGGHEGDVTSLLAPSAMGVNTMKQLQILADILNASASMEDKEAIMTQVLKKFVGVMSVAYDDEQLSAGCLLEQAVADLEYVLNAINRLPLDEQTIEGCTQGMRALHLRKLSAVDAHHRRLQAEEQEKEEALQRKKKQEEEENEREEALRRKKKQEEDEQEREEALRSKKKREDEAAAVEKAHLVSPITNGSIVVGTVEKDPLGALAPAPTPVPTPATNNSNGAVVPDDDDVTTPPERDPPTTAAPQEQEQQQQQQPSTRATTHDDGLLEEIPLTP